MAILSRFHHPHAKVTAVALACILLGLAIRLYALEDLGYWFDEAISIRMAEMPVGEMFERCSRDTSPPLFFLCLKPWIWVFGKSPLALRAQTVLWSLAAVGCVFGFNYEASIRQNAVHNDARRNLAAATVSGVLMALSPLQLTWAQQVRFYAPIACLTVGSTWLLWRAIDQPGNWGRWCLFGGAVVIGLYTHVTMTLVFAAQIAALALIMVRNYRLQAKGQRLLILRFLVTSAVVATAYLPWFFIMQGQHKRVREGFWSRELNWEDLDHSIAQCFTVSEIESTNLIAGYPIAQVMFLGMLVLLFGRKPYDFLVFCTSIAPFVGLVIISLLDVNLIHPRYFISGYTMICLAVGTIVARLPWRHLRYAFATILVGIQMLLAVEYFHLRSSASEKPDLEHVLTVWDEYRSSDDQLIFCTPMFYITALYCQVGPSNQFVIGPSREHKFYHGTAAMADSEYLSRDAINASAATSIWTCDIQHTSDDMISVCLGDSWSLVAEKSIDRFQGSRFILRHLVRGERIE